MNPEHIEILSKEGFTIPKLHPLEKSFDIDPSTVLNGIILNTGVFIICNGFNEHRYIYPLLYSLKLVNDPDWIDDDSAIHVSSNQLNGMLVSTMTDVYCENIIPDEQLNTLFSLRKNIDGSYGSYEKVSDILYQYVSKIENHGGKYNGLRFLERFYKNINLPQFFKYPYGIDIKHNVCIRTSPKYSLPGLLNSKFNVTPSEFKSKIKEIKLDYKKHVDIKNNNKLHYFFQQQLDGINGVCHVRGKDRKFSYDASENQGDIVKGKKGKTKLTEKITGELKEIAIELAEDFNKSIQLEFVVSNDVLYIVQFRVLGNEPNETVILNEPTNAICFGKTFSYGSTDVEVNDILIVEEDGDSSLLIGKKALIVTGDVEFSHLLALSKALKIPSMYATGNVDLSNKKKVKFVAYNNKSWIV